MIKSKFESINTDDKIFPFYFNLEIYQKSKEFEMQVHLLEYTSLRAEQLKRFETNDKILHYLVIIVAAFIGSIYASIKFNVVEYNKLFTSTFLFVPIITAPLVFYSLHNEVIINRIGRYIYNNLRLKIQALVMNHDVWLWEVYHFRESYRPLFLLTAILRRFIFIMPFLLPLVLCLINKNTIFSFWEKVIFGVDLLFLSLIIILLINVVIIFHKGVSLSQTSDKS
jgi:hypothetical protein